MQPLLGSTETQGVVGRLVWGGGFAAGSVPGRDGAVGWRMGLQLVVGHVDMFSPCLREEGYGMSFFSFS